jgi:opacity protein-like surface antigen
MKTIVLSILVASAGVSLAGESPAKGTLIPAAVIPQTSGCADCLKHSGLFLGAGVDYFTDSDDVYYNGRVGREWAGASGNFSQSLFLEAGWLDSDNGIGGLEAIPITLNYEYKRALFKCLNFYVGAGAGIAFVDSHYYADTKDEAAGILSDRDDTVFIFQAFAGLTYCVTDNVELYGGVRYLWSDDIGDGDGFDDWSIGAGLRVKF